MKNKNKLKKKKIKILNNFESHKSFMKSDLTISAIPGLAGLRPTISMIKNSKNTDCKQGVSYMWMEYN